MLIVYSLAHVPAVNSSSTSHDAAAVQWYDYIALIFNGKLMMSAHKQASPIPCIYMLWSSLMWLFVLFAFIQMTMSVCNEATYFNACLLHHRAHLNDPSILSNFCIKYCQLQLIIKHLAQMLSL